MTTSSVARIIDQARLSAPGTLDGVLRMELFNTLKDFFRRTDIWRETIDVYAQPGVAEYQLPLLTTALVTRLLWLEGPRVPPSTSIPDPKGISKRGWLKKTAVRGTILQIEMAPAQNETWHAHVGLTVVDPTDAEGLPRVPDWIIESYHDYLASGLLSRVLMHLSKPYSNKEMAAYHGRRFNEGLGLAKKEAAQGFVAGGQAWAFPQTFRARTQRYW
jgi:hypothetical protein